MTVKYTVVAPEHCDDMLLYSTLSAGHWTNAAAETFSPIDSPVPTHLHFYTTPNAAREKVWKHIKHLVPSTITTVSFSKKDD